MYSWAVPTHLVVLQQYQAEVELAEGQLQVADFAAVRLGHLDLGVGDEDGAAAAAQHGAVGHRPRVHLSQLVGQLGKVARGLRLFLCRIPKFKKSQLALNSPWRAIFHWSFCW